MPRVVKRLNKLLVKAEARARAERAHFKKIVLPARMAEIESEITKELQEWAPGVEFRFNRES